MARLRELLKIDMWCVNERDFLLSCLVVSQFVSGPEKPFALLYFASVHFALYCFPFPLPLSHPCNSVYVRMHLR